MDFISNINPILGILILSILPFFEARFAIPFGIAFYKLNPLTVYLVAIVGSFLAILLLTLCIYKITPLIQWKWFNKLVNKVFSYTRKKHSKLFEQVATTSVIAFIAVPFPGTGIYSGNVICYLLGFSPKKTIIVSTIGMVIAATVMLFTTIGIKAIL